MKLFLYETPNDKRTWSTLPTHNQVSTLQSDRSIEINEDPRGGIFIERYTHIIEIDNKKHYFPWYVRVSSDNNKSIHSNWIKRFTIKSLV